MRAAAQSAVILSIVVALASSCLARVDQETVQRWFDAEWEQASHHPPLDSVVFRYRVEWPVAMSAAELAQAREEIAGKPDHPKRLAVEMNERRLRSGPDVSRRTLWTQGPGRWRLNSDELYIDTFTDRASDTKRSWTMTRNQLAIMDPANPPAGRDNSQIESQYLMEVDRLLTGGLNALRSVGGAPAPVTVAGDRWTATVAGDGFTLKYEGRWDEEAERGFVETVRLVESKHAPPGEAWRIDKWVEDPVLGSWVARRVEVPAPDGRPDYSIIFEGAEPFDPADFQVLVAVPSVERPDPARGTLTVTKVYDFRPGREALTSLHDGERYVEPLPAQAVAESSRTLRRAGWATLALLGAGLVAVRILRSRRHART